MKKRASLCNSPFNNGPTSAQILPQRLEQLISKYSHFLGGLTTTGSEERTVHSGLPHSAAQSQGDFFATAGISATDLAVLLAAVETLVALSSARFSTGI